MGVSNSPINNNICTKDESGEMDAHCAEARAALQSYGYPPGHESEICIALDVSGSMDNPNQFYNSGKIQKLIEKAMALAIELSPTESVTIFPFGRIAYEPIIIEEHDMETAVSKVFASIGNTFSDKTNYCAPIAKIREYYFGNSYILSAPVIHDRAPVYVLFVTDGEPNIQIDEAMNQFRACEYNAMFIRFVALKGNQANLNFHRLRIICNKTNSTFLPNKHTLILDDPNYLTIDDLFFGHRTWLEEAYEHGVLTKDPGVELDSKNPNNRREIRYKQSIEDDHGHDDTALKHGHVNRQYGAISTDSNIIYDHQQCCCVIL